MIEKHFAMSTDYKDVLLYKKEIQLIKSCNTWKLYDWELFWKENNLHECLREKKSLETTLVPMVNGANEQKE